MRLKSLISSLVVLAVGFGAASPAGAAVDPYMNNAVPSPGRAVFNGMSFDPITISNQVPIILARGYGRCVLVSSRTDMTLYNGEIQGSMNAIGRQVVDNGSCSGANINEYMWVDTAKVFNDHLVADCNDVSAEGYGPVTAWRVKPGCAVPAQPYNSFGSPYSIGPAKGYYRQFTVVTTIYGQWATSPVNHLIY